MSTMSRYFIPIILLFHFGADAQVTIAPPLVVMDRENPYGSFVVINRAGQEQEITISFRYGYPASDGEGNISIQYRDDPDTSDRSAAEWVRAFPRRFVLGPMQEQTVRLTVRPQRPVPDGTYTARIITSSKQSNRDRSQAVNENELSTSIDFQFNQVSALMYRHGKTTTGVEIVDIKTIDENGSFDVIASLRKTGNSPYIGSVVLQLYDPDGKMVHEKVESIAVYKDMVRRFRIESGSVNPGEYKAELTATTGRRSDVSPSSLIKVPDVTKTFSIVIR